MDDVRLGTVCRALRRRLGLRQADLAERARVSQDQISRLERGLFSGMPYHTIRTIFAAMGAGFTGTVGWRGGELDRLLDEDHAALVGRAAMLYQRSGWQVSPEVSFQHYGDRGSIDLLALHPETRTASINEVKTDIVSVEETHRRHDVKMRLATAIVEERVGWRPLQIGRILIVPETSRVRRAVARHVAVFAAAYPADGRAIRSWIREPAGSLAGIWFLSFPHEDRVGRGPGGPRRVRVASSRTAGEAPLLRHASGA